MSTLVRFDLPVQIGILLFTLGLILALAPYFGGLDFGVLKVPNLGPEKSAFLKRYGWSAPLLALLLFLPLWPESDSSSKSSNETAFRVRFAAVEGQLDCAKLRGVTVTVRTDTSTRNATIGADCVAAFSQALAGPAETSTVSISGASYIVVSQRTQPDSQPLEIIATLADAARAPRLSIAVLPFDVQDPAAQVQLQQFSEALSVRILSMSQDFSSKGQAFSYMDGLKVVNGGPPRPSGEDLSRFWSQTHALQLVRGNVLATNGVVVVRGLVFLGDLAPPTARRVVAIDMPIRPEDLSNNQDSYSLVILYALARDAERLQYPKDVIAAYLAQAYLVGQQINTANGDLALIKTAVDTMLQRLRPAGSPQ